jgi:MoxR-like ATPase
MSVADIPAQVTTAGIERFRDPARYVPDDDLVAAVQVAILLRQPLLLTGDPGAGKTQVAAWLAHKLGRPLIRFVAKSSTSATDLLYHFDAVREFRESQHVGDKVKSEQYLAFQALGRAIALTYSMDTEEMRAVWDEEANRPPGEPASRRREATASIVLVDEIDKAPRDVPNDLLTEFETGEFFIPELRVRLRVQADRVPIVVATSNSEKALPDAFLRRCVFYHIEMPKGDRLHRILQVQLPELKLESPVVRDALDLFTRLQGPSPELVLRKRPSLPELLGLLLVITDRPNVRESAMLAEKTDAAPALLVQYGLKVGLTSSELGPGAARVVLSQLLSILFKTKDDQDAARDWLRELWQLPEGLIPAPNTGAI